MLPVSNMKICLCMRNKCINSTSGRKSVSGKGFSNIDFLYYVESFAVRRCFSSILAIFHHARAVSTITTSGLKSDVIILIQRTCFPIKTLSFRARDTIFIDVCNDNVCACAVSTLILVPLVNVSPKIHEMTIMSPHILRTEWGGVWGGVSPPQPTNGSGGASSQRPSRKCILAYFEGHRTLLFADAALSSSNSVSCHITFQVRITQAYTPLSFTSRDTGRCIK